MSEQQKVKKKGMENVFFDIHCHAMNFSHPGLLAFLNRVLKDHGLNLGDITELHLFKIYKAFIAPFKKQIIGLLVFIVIYFLVEYRTESISVATDQTNIFIKAWGLWLEKAFVVGLIVAVIVFVIFKIKALREKLNKTLNLMSVMDNDIGSMFIYMENDLLETQVLKKADDAPDDAKGYDRAIITPLVMDFGSTRLKFDQAKAFHYDDAPHKPVVKQVIDLLDGISDYRRRSKHRLLEIYPFLGLNTKNYKLGTILDIPGLTKDAIKEFSENSPQISSKIYCLEKCDKPVIVDVIDREEETALSNFLTAKGIVSDIKQIIKNSNSRLSRNATTLSRLLNKYFNGYKKDTNIYDALSNNFAEAFPKAGTGKYDGSIDVVGDFYFAGIKLYPPLGFDPWPEPSIYKEYRYYEEDFYKVNYLYEFCQKKGIPITFHCTASGFKTDAHAKDFAHPDKWRKVLEEYGELKVNFAHFGINDEASNPYEWTKEIIKIMKEYKNVYADFSFKGAEEGFYHKLLEIIRDNEEIKDRLLFGSDFMIVLSQIDSYGDYISKFKNSEMAIDEKIFCSDNPQKFLFGRAEA